MKSDSRIVNFYLKIEPDIRGRMLDFIWQQDYKWLEATHDYIQWLFPLKEKSRFNPNAPILTEEDVYNFKSSQEIKQNLIYSLKIMLSFYGLKIRQPDVIISIDKDSFIDRKKQWLHWGNHNHMRISRILKSLNLIGLEEYTKAFFDCLQEIVTVQRGTKLVRLRLIK